MVELSLVDGRKGLGDKLVKVSANDEVLAFSEILFILQHYFRSEDSYYPKVKGFDGSNMLLKAIIMVHRGVSVEDVCKKFDLEYKVNVR